MIIFIFLNLDFFFIYTQLFSMSTDVKLKIWEMTFGFIEDTQILHWSLQKLWMDEQKYKQTNTKKSHWS